jgi:hypothetical protein
VVRSDLILIGYWRRDAGAGWPGRRTVAVSARLRGSGLGRGRAGLVADYLGRGFVVRAYMGYSPCRFCGDNNGALELSDGTYVWPEGLRHYVTDHDVRLPEPFVGHVLASIEAFENAGRGESWWRGFA